VYFQIDPHNGTIFVRVVFQSVGVAALQKSQLALTAHASHVDVNDGCICKIRGKGLTVLVQHNETRGAGAGVPVASLRILPLHKSINNIDM
jgi:hypothetical protein